MRALEVASNATNSRKAKKSNTGVPYNVTSASNGTKTECKPYTKALARSKKTNSFLQSSSAVPVKLSVRIRLCATQDGKDLTSPHGRIFHEDQSK